MADRSCSELCMQGQQVTTTKTRRRQDAVVVPTCRCVQGREVECVQRTKNMTKVHVRAHALWAWRRRGVVLGTEAQLDYRCRKLMGNRVQERQEAHIVCTEPTTWTKAYWSGWKLTLTCVRPKLKKDDRRPSGRRRLAELSDVLEAENELGLAGKHR